MDERKSKKDKSKKSGGGDDIINLAEYRKNKHDQKMREYERILFNRILGVYSFAEKSGLHHV